MRDAEHGLMVPRASGDFQPTPIEFCDASQSRIPYELGLRFARRFQRSITGRTRTVSRQLEFEQTARR